jgi:F-type H+-transporting ATPase subunit delta
MKDTKTAERYANGFIDAFNPEDMQELLVEVRVLKEVLKANPEISELLSSYVIKEKDKLNLLEPFSSESKFSDYWQNLILLLDEKTRLNLFNEIIYFSEQYILLELNIVKITIKTAHELVDEMKDKIIKFLTDKVNKIVEASFIVEPEVIGGFIAESDNFIVDSSVKRSLEQFRLSLIKM